MLNKRRVWEGTGFGSKISEKVLRGERPFLKEEHDLFNPFIIKCWQQVFGSTKIFQKKNLGSSNKTYF
jgi:hypothetical protein